MRQGIVSLPALVLVAGTRVALGIGLGLLMSERLKDDTRRGAGWTLVAVGALSVAILFFDEADALFGKRSEVKDNDRPLAAVRRR